MSAEYYKNEVRLARCILASETAIVRLKEELFSVKEWIRESLDAKNTQANLGHNHISLSDMPREIFEDIFRCVDYITRNRLRRVCAYWKAIISQRHIREEAFFDPDSFYGRGAPFFLRMVDWTTDQTAALTEVKRAAFPLRRVTYNANDQGFRFRSSHIYKLDQCEMLRKFLTNCPNLEQVTICRLPGMTWLNLTACLTIDCPKLETIYAFKCDQTVDVLQPNYTYSPARKRMYLSHLAVSMVGDISSNFDLASDALLWPYPDVKEHVAWIAKYIPLLSGKAHNWAKVFLKKHTGLKEGLDKIDLRTFDYFSLARNYWLLDLTSLILHNPVPGMEMPSEKFVYR